MDPFAEIQITPLFSRDGMQSQGKSVRIADDSTSSGWNEIGVVSQNYLLVHNARAKEVLVQIAERSGIPDWKERKCYFDGRRFVYALSCDNLTAQVNIGDAIRFGLILYNSYDGSRTLQVGAYAEHLICANGMTSESFFTRCSFKHQQGNINWDEEVERIFLAIMPSSKEKLAQFANVLGKLHKKVLTTITLSSLRESFLKDLSIAQWGKIMDRFLLHEDHTAFGLLDACTRVFWHNEKQNYSDYRNNSYATDALIGFADSLRS